MIKECRNCGGKIIFSPKHKGNICINCGSIFPINYDFEFVKRPFEDSENLNAEISKDIKTVKCDSCGATVIMNKYDIHTKCTYCGNPAITETRKADLMNIDSIIPFAFDKKEALNMFKHSVLKSFYANKKILKTLTEKDIVGTYINAFVFDINTISSYSGVFSYTVSEKDTDGVVRNITRQKHVNGIIEKEFNNITIEANSNLNQTELMQIMPFDYVSAVKFVPDFMHGYVIEYHDKIFDECFKSVRSIMEHEIKQTLLKNYKCDTIEELALDINYNDRKYSYCLLPVYFVNAKNKNKDYNLLMNGQTGKVGKLPKDKFKIGLTIFGVCAIILAIILSFILI